MQQIGVDNFIEIPWGPDPFFEDRMRSEEIEMKEYGHQYKVPNNLLKKELNKLLKETNAGIDRLREMVREHGMDSNTGIFIEFTIERYAIKKKRIKDILMYHQKIGSDNNGDIDKAKLFPISEIIEINSAGFAKCPFHEEKTPSAKWYKEDNRLHCFGSCSKGFDAIDVHMQVYNVDFISALKSLS